MEKIYNKRIFKKIRIPRVIPFIEMSIDNQIYMKFLEKYIFFNSSKIYRKKMLFKKKSFWEIFLKNCMVLFVFLQKFQMKYPSENIHLRWVLDFYLIK